MVRLNDDELSTIKPLAKNLEQSLAVYVRNCALNKKLTAKFEKKIYAKYTNQLAWIGNNLNQIARILNYQHKANENIDYAEMNLRLHEISKDISYLKLLLTQDQD